MKHGSYGQKSGTFFYGPRCINLRFTYFLLTYFPASGTGRPPRGADGSALAAAGATMYDQTTLGDQDRQADGHVQTRSAVVCGAVDKIQRKIAARRHAAVEITQSLARTTERRGACMHRQSTQRDSSRCVPNKQKQTHTFLPHVQNAGQVLTTS